MFKNKIVKSLSNNNLNKLKKKLPDFSYGKFLINNPKASKNERRNAILKFLKNTR